MDFDPLKDNDPSNLEEAVALARAWASGKRSWTNLRASGYSHDTIAMMDAQEVVKFGALAQMYAVIESAGS